MRILVGITGDFRRFEQRTGAAFQPARRFVSQLAKEAKADARAALRGSRSGRRYGGGNDRSVYKLVKRRAVLGSARTRAYTASAPGEAPARRTGTLLRAIRSARVKGKRGADAGFTFFVFADRRTAFYQRFLEFGVRRFGIAPRPLFGPLQDRYQRRLVAGLPREIEKGWQEVMR